MQDHNISEDAERNSGVSSVVQSKAPTHPARFSLGELFIPEVDSSFSENVLQYCDSYIGGTQSTANEEAAS
jgi:hypothetical protein